MVRFYVALSIGFSFLIGLNVGVRRYYPLPGMYSSSEKFGLRIERFPDGLRVQCFEKMKYPIVDTVASQYFEFGKGWLLVK